MKNIEDNIKKEFQNREIKPSKSAWEVLNAQLEVTSTKKENKKWRFLAYAAIFIGLLFSLTTFFNSDAFDNKQPIIVDVDPIKVNNQTDEKLNVNEDLIKNEPTEIVEVIVKKPLIKPRKQQIINKPKVDIVKTIKKENTDIKSKNRVFNVKKVNAPNQNKELIAFNNQAKVNKEENKPQISENQKNLRETKTQSPKKKLFSTDDDIDLMLANALNKEQSNTIKQVSIQNTYLQYHVESEINTPIGNKILKTLKAGVDTVEEYITSNN